MKKYIDKIKQFIINNKGISIIGILALVFLIFTFTYLFNSRNISSIEEKELKNSSREFVNYIEDITLSKSKDIDKYILYALDYSYNVKGKDSLTVSEIYEFYKENFTLKISEDSIKNIGITPMLVERNITYDTTSESYKLNNIENASVIAETPITYYKIESISKINRKKYSITYRKYTIKNPYDILNYYIEKNTNAEGKENDGIYTYDLKDLNPIRNYLSGTGKIGSLKNSIDEDVSKFGKKGNKLKITYVMKDDKLLIDKIK